RRSISPPSRPRGWKKPGRSSEGPMNWKKIYAIVRREYIERVRTKAFWIATLVIPFFFMALIGIQIAVSKKAGGERKIAVLDLTGLLYQPLVQDLDEQEQKIKKEFPGRRPIHWALESRPVTGDLAASKK